jgi:hypothetical protein
MLNRYLYDTSAIAERLHYGAVDYAEDQGQVKEQDWCGHDMSQGSKGHGEMRKEDGKAGGNYKKKGTKSAKGKLKRIE